MRRFGYARVSTFDQDSDNQLLALQERGFDIASHRWFSETISGGIPALQRPEFSAMLARMEQGDELVVLRLDRLGRDVIDVLSTIDELRHLGIGVRSLDLDGVDLSSPAGRLQLTVLGAISEFERQRIRERTMDGLAKAAAAGRKGGRPKAVKTTRAVQQCKKAGMTQEQAALTVGLSLSTIKRHWRRSAMSSS